MKSFATHLDDKETANPAAYYALAQEEVSRTGLHGASPRIDVVPGCEAVRKGNDHE